jgi:hypothetical protein
MHETSSPRRPPPQSWSGPQSRRTGCRRCAGLGRKYIFSRGRARPSGCAAEAWPYCGVRAYSNTARRFPRHDAVHPLARDFGPERQIDFHARTELNGLIGRPLHGVAGLTQGTMRRARTPAMSRSPAFPRRGSSAPAEQSFSLCNRSRCASRHEMAGVCLSSATRPVTGAF